MDKDMPDFFDILKLPGVYSFNAVTFRNSLTGKSVDICTAYVPEPDDEIWGYLDGLKEAGVLNRDFNPQGPFGFDWIAQEPSGIMFYDSPGSIDLGDEYYETGVREYEFPEVPDSSMRRRAEELIGTSSKGELDVIRYIDSLEEGVDLVNCMRGCPCGREDENEGYAFVPQSLPAYALPAMAGFWTKGIGRYSKAIGKMGETLRMPEKSTPRMIQMKPVGDETRRVLIEIPEPCNVGAWGDFIIYAGKDDGEGHIGLSTKKKISREYMRDYHPGLFRRFSNPELDRSMCEPIADVLADKSRLPEFVRISGNRYAVRVPDDVAIRDKDGRCTDNILGREYKDLTFPAEDYLNARSYKELARKATLGGTFTWEDLHAIRESYDEFCRSRSDDSGKGSQGGMPASESQLEKKTKTMRIMESQIGALAKTADDKTRSGT